MAKVSFEPSNYAVDDVAVGTEIADLTDKHPKAEVPYSCRSASCGTCRVEVKSGMSALNEPDDDELDVLEIFGNEENVRLCCQIKLVKDEDLVLRVCDPD